MLVRLRGRIRGWALDSADLDQLVISTFIEVAHDFPLERRQDRTSMYLRQITQRRVFRIVRKESALAAIMSFQSVANVDPANLPAWPSPQSRHDMKAEPEDVDDSEAVALLANRASSVAQDHINLVVATVVHGEPLRRHVARTFPQQDPVELDRTYQRLKRQRTRTFERLRPLFADLHSPDLTEPEAPLVRSET
jgi:hypothetical protein